MTKKKSFSIKNRQKSFPEKTRGRSGGASQGSTATGKNIRTCGRRFARRRIGQKKRSFRERWGLVGRGGGAVAAQNEDRGHEATTSCHGRENAGRKKHYDHARKEKAETEHGSKEGKRR